MTEGNMIEVFDTEQQWLEARRKYVTSTEVSALFGQNPRLTAFELACIKRDPKLDTFEATERTKWGQALQDAIATRAALENGVGIASCGFSLATYGACAASGDYIIVSRRGGDTKMKEWHARLGSGMLEIKNVDSLVYKNEWTDVDMPDHIEIQLQAELLCWDKKWGVVGVLVGGNKLVLYFRERDPKVCELIVAKSLKFMSDLAEGVLPPPTMPEDAGMVIALHQYAEPNKVFDATGDDYLVHLCTEYKEHSAIMDRASKARDSIRATILSRIGDAERVVNLAGFNLSASVRPPTHVEAYERAGFRGFNLTVKKSGGKNKV